MLFLSFLDLRPASLEGEVEEKKRKPDFPSFLSKEGKWRASQIVSIQIRRKTRRKACAARAPPLPPSPSSLALSPASLSSLPSLAPCPASLSIAHLASLAGEGACVWREPRPHSIALAARLASERARAWGEPDSLPSPGDGARAWGDVHEKAVEGKGGGSRARITCPFFFPSIFLSFLFSFLRNKQKGYYE